MRRLEMAISDIDGWVTHSSRRIFNKHMRGVSMNAYWYKGLWSVWSKGKELASGEAGTVERAKIAAEAWVRGNVGVE